MIDRFLRPFLAGVFLERDLTTSSRFFDLVWRVVRPRPRSACRPAACAGSREQLAAGLPEGAVRHGIEVGAVTAGRVVTDQGTVRAGAMVVATDPATAARLLPGIAAPRMNAVTTVYHAAAEPPVGEPHAGAGRRARRRPIVNRSCSPRPHRATPRTSRALMSTSVLGTDPPAEAALRRELERLLGVSTAGWETVATVRVPAALPAAPPPLRIRQPVDLGDGLYVAGDHRDTPSIQGAMVSGRRAATAVLRARRTESAT